MTWNNINTAALQLGVLCLCTLPWFGGCNRGELRYAPAAGIVTLDGKPIHRAEVVLLCDDVTVKPRPTSRGVTDRSGRFEMKSLTPDKRLVDGAVVGKHHVAVTTRILELDAHGAAHVVREEALGKEYTNGELLTVEIPAEGATELRFDVKSGKAVALNSQSR